MLLRTKVLTRDYGNFGFFEEVIGKVAGRSQFFAVRRSTQQGADVRKNVECPLRFETTHALYRVESIDNDIATLMNSRTIVMTSSCGPLIASNAAA